MTPGAPVGHAPATYGGWQSEVAGFVGRASVGEFVLAAAAFLSLAFVRVGGMGASQWVWTALRHAVSVCAGGNQFLSGAFAPWRLGDDGQPEQPMHLPGVLARLTVLAAPTGTGAEVAVVHDPSDSTVTAVLRLRYPGLALADQDLQGRRVSAWGTFLASVCGETGAISRVAVVERAQPDDGTALASWTDQHTAVDAPAAAVESLTGLLREAGPSACNRHTYLSVTLAVRRARASVRAAGGGPGGAAAVLLRELFAMQTALAAADLRVEAWLGPRQLAEVIRTGFDPDSVPALATRRASPARTGSTATGSPAPGSPAAVAGVDPALAGPAAAHTSWSTYRHDGAHSVTYQVRHWPRSPVLATALHPLLRPRPGARRSFALVCEPIPPSRARRALARDRTRRHVRISLRRRSGRLDSPDDLADLARADRQDQARAAGHGLLRFVGLVTVTVTDEAVLEAACCDLQADAGAARLELRRLYGAQDSGFAACVLPLGQGLPVRRGDL